MIAKQMVADGRCDWEAYKCEENYKDDKYQCKKQHEWCLLLGNPSEACKSEYKECLEEAKLAYEECLNAVENTFCDVAKELESSLRKNGVLFKECVAGSEAGYKGIDMVCYYQLL